MAALVQQPPVDLFLARAKADGYTVTGRQVKQDDSAEKERLLKGTNYEPSLEWWESNQASYQAPADDPLPAGFPEQIVSPSLWDGQELIHQPSRWLYTFTPEDVAALEAAYDHFASLNLHNNEVNTSTFPIDPKSGLYAALKEAEREIKSGLGFRVLRGLPVDSWKRNKQLVIFAGVGSYIGRQRVAKGREHVTHLRDITGIEADKRPAIVLKGQTAANQVFHNDGSVGIVGLITVGIPETGGLSQLSSVAATYNDLARTRRDVVRELAKGDWISRAHPKGIALLHAVGDGQVVSSYSRRPFFGFYESDPDVPPLTEAKHLALDAIHYTAEKYRLDLALQKGDLEYFNNVTVFHARTESTDSERNQRHLIRMWLTNEEQALPEELKRDNQKQLESGTLAGADRWPLEAWD